MSDTIYKKFYVYAWLKKSGEPYYIGKGKDQRAWRKGCGKVQILASNLSEKDAFAFEALLIKKLGRKDLGEGPLHNKNDGMIGGDTSHHPNYIKSMKERDISGEKNPMYGRKRGKECSNGLDISGDKNPMYDKGHLLKGKTKNKRLKCPLCDMESNSSNIKVHIKKTHKLDWREYLNAN